MRGCTRFAIAMSLLAGCGSRAHPEVDVTSTTGAIVTGAKRVQPDERPVLSERTLEALPPPLNEDTRAVDAGEVPPYQRPPLHESRGSTYSDVGMPYPTPSVPAVEPSPPRRSPPSVPAPFPETSFGPTLPSSSFVESSFGPDAGIW
jgi:hypothetical protein